MLENRLKIAKTYLDDAFVLAKDNRFNSAVSRAYYASYQAMWAALGDPVDGNIWRHLAIIKHFVRGYWFKPNHQSTGPGLLEDKRLPLRRLYSYRIKSDYDAMLLEKGQITDLLAIVKEIVRIIEQKGSQI